MIPRNIIEKAILGGWERHTAKLEKAGIHVSDIDGIWQAIALDRTFWQALGKSCGWEKQNWLMYLRESDTRQPIPFSVSASVAYGTLFAHLILTGGNGCICPKDGAGSSECSNCKNKQIEKYWEMILK